MRHELWKHTRERRTSKDLSPNKKLIRKKNSERYKLEFLKSHKELHTIYSTPWQKIHWSTVTKITTKKSPQAVFVNEVHLRQTKQLTQCSANSRKHFHYLMHIHLPKRDWGINGTNLLSLKLHLTIWLTEQIQVLNTEHPIMLPPLPQSWRKGNKLIM